MINEINNFIVTISPYLTVKRAELKKYFYKQQEEPIGRDGITEYDIDRIKGKYNEKQQSHERTQRND